IYMPTTTIPALNHYRLVHESSRNVIGSGGPDIRYVKVFEYVPGARIKGNGVIELQIVTDAGRQFTWREASMNGEFIVPYSTSGSPYEVKAAGKYHISGSNQEFDVTEDAVRTGSAIN
ncbi:MAG: oligosaccharyl transferase, archaeosortase A system-associated, partial [Methanoregulaceae archaeon]|nr:oligosaccharyl transferase, archaeosortase A system-associated [Methanoregulaceae archaeon]